MDKQRAEEDKEIMIQIIKEEKMMREQQQEKIAALTKFIISAGDQRSEVIHTNQLV